MMHPEFFRQIAQRCRDLMVRTQSEFAREQLQLWVDEFESHAELGEPAPQRAARPDQP